MNPANPRKAALELLCRIETEGTYSNLGLQDALAYVQYSAADRRLLTRLVYGVLENRLYIDAVIRKYSKTAPEKMKPWVLNALRIALYQLKWMERIPASAAINESVKLVKLRYGALSGFANGVLRTALRQGVDLADIDCGTTQGLSLLYSHPLWMVERWVGRFGFEKTEAILKANNTPNVLTLRVNSLKVTPRELIRDLEVQGVFAHESPLLEEALLITELGDQELPDLQAFKEGLFNVQDISSMLVSRAIAPKAGERILDLCAAPGGKTTHLAEVMGNQGEIIAQDIYPHKVKLIEESALRLGITSVQAVQGDVLDTKSQWLNGFDHVLLDAPCSGTGIIRKKPEIRFNRKPEDILALSRLQGELLEQAKGYVKNHGQLIYSTCTMEYEENEGVLQEFLSRNPEFSLVDVNDKIPESLRNATPTIRIYPSADGLDGFFIAVMKKHVLE